MNNKQAQSRRQQRLAQQRAKEHVQRRKRAIKADLVFADPIKHLPEKLPDPWLFNSESAFTRARSLPRNGALNSHTNTGYLFCSQCCNRRTLESAPEPSVSFAASR